MEVLALWAVVRRGKAAKMIVLGFALLGTVGFGSPSQPEFPCQAAILWQRVLYKTLGNPITPFAVADVNADGLLDIVAGDLKVIRVFLGEPGGEFGKETIAGFYEAKREPFSPRGDLLPLFGDAGDFDGDGLPDLAVAVLDLEDEVCKIYVLRNLWGQWFDKVVSWSLPFRSSIPEKKQLRIPISALKVGDMNGDGKMDILVVGGDPGEIGVYLFAGLEEFSFGELQFVAPAPGQLFCLADFDGDGAMDLGFYTETAVIVLFGDGKGAFPAVVRFPQALEEERVRAVGAGDLDGDGDLDVILATGKSLRAGLLEDRTFKAAGTVAISGTDLVVGDFTGEGIADCLVGDGKIWRLVPGDGQGGFLGICGEFIFFLSSAKAVDLDSDGLADLMPSGLPMSELLVVRSRRPPAGETRIPFDGNALLAVGDLTDDGAPELLTWNREGIEVLWNNGKGGFIRSPWFKAKNFAPLVAKLYQGFLHVLQFKERVEVLDWKNFQFRVIREGEVLVIFGGQEVQRYTLGEEPAPTLEVADIDGNGVPEVIGLLKHAIVVIWDGVDSVRYPWEEGELSLVWAGDLGLRRPELLVVSTAEYAELYRLSFEGRELRAKELLLKMQSVPLAVAAGDLDADGVADAVFACLAFAEEKGTLSMYTELAMVLSRLGPKNLRTDLPLGQTPLPLVGLAVGDLQGDGFGDVILSVVSGEGLFFLAGKGDGTFAPGRWLEMAIPVGTGPVFASDLDGNGIEDVVASTSGQAPHLVILWNGGGR
ncbi:MAG: FG-GAP repeat domain-containing protein [Candidatus Bipolaricaulaceae bacterium]